MPWRINLSLKKYTFCDNWTKIVAQSWFGARIYPRAFTLECWPLNFRIKVIKYIFSLVFVKKILAKSDHRFKRYLGTNSSQTTDNRQQTTDRQTTDRQTFLSWPPSIWEFFFFFFFCTWEGENEWGEIYTSLLATQVCFAHLLCSQGDKILTAEKQINI